MTAPRMDRALVLEHRVQSPDGAGGFLESWVALGTIWAAFRPGSGGQVAREEQRRMRIPWRILCRAAPPGHPERPQAGQRLRERDRIFDILAVAEAEGAARHLICFAREEGPA